MIKVVRVIFSETSMSVDSVQALWTKLACIQGARWRQETLKIPFDAAAVAQKIKSADAYQDEETPEARFK